MERAAIVTVCGAVIVTGKKTEASAPGLRRAWEPGSKSVGLKTRRVSGMSTASSRIASAASR